MEAAKGIALALVLGVAIWALITFAAFAIFGT